MEAPLAPEATIHDVIVIGSGPAGMTAALYAARASLDTIVIVGPQLGGQVALTWEIDNYLGLFEDLTGPELVDRMVKHVEKFGARLVYDVATSVDLDGPIKTVTGGSAVYRARSVVVSAGASSRLLDVPGEKELTGRGVSYCATCDGAFFRDQDVAVVGGGDSALEEALFLTRFARSIRIVHRRDALRAGPQLQERALNHEKIRMDWNTVIEEINGDGRVDHVTTRRTDTGEVGRLDVTGVFVFIGHFPNSGIFAGKLDMDDHGYLIIDDHTRTNEPGVFACGEIADPVWKQIGTSVGQGVMAGMAVEEFLSHQEAAVEAPA